jgi:hypothetical protein
MMARKHKHICFYVWDSATREAALQEKAPLVLLQKLRRKVFEEWKGAAKQQAVDNKDSYEAEMRQQEIMGMMRDADLDADAREAAEEEVGHTHRLMHPHPLTASHTLSHPRIPHTPLHPHTRMSYSG